jgi:hypothetical protein
MISAPVVITGRSSRRYTTSVVRVDACPASRAISPMLTPRCLIEFSQPHRYHHTSAKEVHAIESVSA